MGAHEAQHERIEALDGTSLAATWWSPDDEPVQTTLIAPAMGVPRGFYDRLAGSLAERGHRVVSFDYRGIGGSAPADLRGSEARLLDWGRLDLPAAIQAAADRAEGGSIALLGHSVAGQIFGLAPTKARVDRALFVASVKGYWRRWHGLKRLSIAVMAFGLVPALTRLFGYLPSQLSGLGGEDLPAGVAREWARWIRHPDYVVDEDGEHPREAFAAYEGQLFGVNAADDWYAPAEAVQALLAMYPNAETRHVELVPEEHGLEAIGHFGFFHPRCRSLWEEGARWLEGSAQTASTSVPSRSSGV